MSSTFVRCERVFTGLEDEVRRHLTLVTAGGAFEYAGPTTHAPAPGAGDALWAGCGCMVDHRPYDPDKVSHFKSTKWSGIYTRDPVAQLQEEK